MSKSRKFQFKVNWRDTWYSVVVWLLAIAVGGFVVLPLYYLVLPLVVFWTTIIYFAKSEKQSLQVGLWCSLFWFFAALALDFLEIIGPYYSNAQLYFSDFRNWLKYPLILLIPVIYSLILETRNLKKKKNFVTQPRQSIHVASN